jgi:hypothetical protein
VNSRPGRSLVAATRVSDPEERLDRLSSLVWKVRSGDRVLTSADATALVSALSEEDDEFLRMILWELIEYAPADPELRALAEHTVANHDVDCRGEALSYLLRQYPSRADSLVQQYAEDQDPYVQDAIARFLEPEDTRGALRHWEKVLSMPEVPQELADQVPIRMVFASSGSEEVLRDLEKTARERAYNPLWRDLLDAIKSRQQGRLK